jgi:hypothetical protein
MHAPLWRGLNAIQLLKIIHSWFYQCHAPHLHLHQEKKNRAWRHASASVFKGDEVFVYFLPDIAKHLQAAGCSNVCSGLSGDWASKWGPQPLLAHTAQSHV